MTREEKINTFQKIKCIRYSILGTMITWIIWLALLFGVIIRNPSYDPTGYFPYIYTFSTVAPIIIMLYLSSLIEIHNRTIKRLGNKLLMDREYNRTKMLWGFLKEKDYSQVSKMYNYENYITNVTIRLFIDGLILGTVNENDVPNWGIDKDDMFNKIFE